jgi:hypothetical protein
MIIDARRLKPPKPGSQKDDYIGDHDRCRQHRRAQPQILLQVRWKQRLDRLVKDKAARHPPARSQGVAQHSPFEDAEERRAHLAVLFALQPAVFRPDRRLLDEVPPTESAGRIPIHNMPRQAMES